MLCGQEALGGRADSPPAGFTTESWRKDLGLQSPSSGTEVIYGSPEEWYDESPESEPLSPGTKQRLHDELEFEKDIDECTTDSDFMSRPEGKTLS